jgi:nicotinamidase-related amidase
MPITTIDPVTALVVIDLQKGIVAIPTVHPAAGVITHAAALAHAFRRRQLPVVLVNVAGGPFPPGRSETPAPSFPRDGDWAEIVPELDPQPGDLRITKMQWGAFYGTPLDLHLRRRRVTQIVLCGIATSIGVESTARAAHEHGYHLTLVTDAMTDRSLEAHQNSVERIFPRLGEIGATADVLARLG